ncbi:MAG: DHHA1 domain-containing protein [Nitrososphaeria archaeon]
MCLGADPEAAAHTAEHVFMRALTKRVNVLPILVEQEGWRGKIVVRGDGPTWADVAGALEEANSVIMEGRPVLEHSFQSIEEARSAFPGLRAYEERISPPVRVVEVQGYDWAACARRHARNTAESWGIAVTEIRSLSGGRHELRFSAGPAAAAAFSVALREAGLSARALNSSVEGLSARLGEVLDQLGSSRAALRSLSRAILRGPRILRAASGAELRVFEAEGLEFKGVLEDAIEAATSSGACLLAVATGDPARVLLACPRGSGVNAGALLGETLRALGGRGGGGPEAATGSVAADRLEELLRALSSRLRTDRCDRASLNTPRSRSIRHV